MQSPLLEGFFLGGLGRCHLACTRNSSLDQVSVLRDLSNPLFQCAGICKKFRFLRHVPCQGCCKMGLVEGSRCSLPAQAGVAAVLHVPRKLVWGLALPSCVLLTGKKHPLEELPLHGSWLLEVYVIDKRKYTEHGNIWYVLFQFQHIILINGHFSHV